MAGHVYPVPTYGPGRVKVGHSSEMGGYFYAQFEHDDNRADAVSDAGEFPTLVDLMIGTRGFIEWAQVPKSVIRSLLFEGDSNEQEATRLLADALAAP